MPVKVDSIGELSAEERERAARLHAEAVVFNALDCTPLRYADGEYEKKLRESGVTAVNHAVSVSDTARPALEKIVAWKRKYAELGVTMFQALDVGDVGGAKRDGRVAFFMGFEDAAQLDGSLWMLELYRELGLRFLGLTYQYRNAAADGCGEPAPGGLSRFGRELVRECNRLGIVLDLSHTSEPSSVETAERSQQPVLITHACLRSRVDNPRNKSDREVKAVAATGGVMCIAAKSGFMSPTGLQRGTTVEDYVDQIEWVAELVGIDHVGVGTDIGDERKYTVETMSEVRRKYPDIPIVGDDLNLATIHPEGLNSPRSLPAITAALVRRGFADEPIRKILGGNVMRALGLAWVGGAH